MWFADNERYGLVKLEDPRPILDFYNKAQVPEIPKTEIHLEVKDEDVDKIVKNVLTTSFNKILDSNNKAESFIQKAVSHIQNKNYTKWDLLFLCEKILYEKVALNSNFKDMKDTINNWASVETFIFDIVTWIFKDADWKVRYDMPDSFKERFKKYIFVNCNNKLNTFNQAA